MTALTRPSNVRTAAGSERDTRAVPRRMPMTEPARDPLLLTPGPLTTAESTKRAMLHDWGSRDGAFIAMTARVRGRLAEIAGGQDVTAVLLQGSGTFVVEAALGTFVPAAVSARAGS